MTPGTRWAVLFATSLAATAAQAQESPQAEVERGVAFFSAGDFARAEEFFVRAVADDSTSADARAWLALSRLRQNRPAEAFGDFEAAIRGGSQVPELHLEMGRCLVLLERHEEALVHLDIHERLFPGHWRTARLQGLALFALGRDSESQAMLLESLRRGDPEASIVPYYSGEAALRKGDPWVALAMFRLAAELAPRSRYGRDAADQVAKLERVVPPLPPRAVETEAAAEPAKEAAGEEEKPWAIRLTFAGGFNDNVILRGEDQVLSREISGEDAGTITESILGSYTFRIDQDSTVVASDSFGWTQYFDLHEFNTLVHNPQISYNRAITDEWRAQVGASWADVYVDTDRFQDEWTFSGKIQWAPRFATWSGTTFAYSHSRSDYYRPTPSAFDRDGFANAIRLTERVSVPDTDLSLSTTYEHAWFRTEGSQFDRNVDRIVTAVGHPIPGMSDVYASLQAGYGWFHYRHADLRDADRDPRRDQIWSVGGGLSWQITREFRIFATTEYLKSQSSNDLFEYDRTQYLAGVEIEF